MEHVIQTVHGNGDAVQVWQSHCDCWQTALTRLVYHSITNIMDFFTIYANQLADLHGLRKVQQERHSSCCCRHDVPEGAFLLRSRQL